MLNVLVPAGSYVFTDYLPASEGQFTYQLVKHLSKFDVFFHVLSPNIHVHNLPTNVNLYKAGTWRLFSEKKSIEFFFGDASCSIHSYMKTKKLLRHEKIDILHFIAPLNFLRSLSLIPFDRAIAKRYPLVVGPGPATPRLTKPGTIRQIINIIYGYPFKRLIKSAAIVTVMNDVAKEMYNKLIDESKIQLIPMGVDTETFKPRKCVSENKIQILTVCTLFRRKHVDSLIKAIKLIEENLPDVLLRIVGEGPEKQSLVKLSKKLGLSDKVIFEGFLDAKEKTRFLQECDVFCLPSLYGYVALLEAMACGKPIVGTGLHGIIQDGVTGYVVPPGDSNSLTEALLRILQDSKLKRRMGIKAREICVKKYSWLEIATKYYNIYTDLVDLGKADLKNKVSREVMPWT